MVNVEAIWNVWPFVTFLTKLVDLHPYAIYDIPQMLSYLGVSDIGPSIFVQQHGVSMTQP